MMRTISGKPSREAPADWNQNCTQNQRGNIPSDFCDLPQLIIVWLSSVCEASTWLDALPSASGNAPDVTGSELHLLLPDLDEGIGELLDTVGASHNAQRRIMGCLSIWRMGGRVNSINNTLKPSIHMMLGNFMLHTSTCSDTGVWGAHLGR